MIIKVDLLTNLTAPVVSKEGCVVYAICSQSLCLTNTLSLPGTQPISNGVHCLKNLRVGLGLYARSCMFFILIKQGRFEPLNKKSMGL